MPHPLSGGLKDAMDQYEKNTAEDSASHGESEAEHKDAAMLHSVHTSIHDDGSFGVHAHMHDGTSKSSKHATHEEAAAKHAEHLKAHAMHHGGK
jgi:hypothetical protein